MISLSQSLTNNKPYQVYAIYDGARHLTNFTHPGDAEASTAAEYKAWLGAHLQQPHSAIYKELRRLAQLHRNGKTVVIVAAIKTLAHNLAKLAGGESSGHAGLATWQELAADRDLIDERRFIWYTSAAGKIAYLAYVWDVEGVITALIPSFGLVKLGRLPNNASFWQRRHLKQLGVGIHTANVKLSRTVERTFARLIRCQQAKEQLDPLHVAFRFGRRRIQADDWRERLWDTREEEQAFGEDPSYDEVVAEAETEAFFNLFATLQSDHFFKYEPTKYAGAHVRPVVKTKPDGTQ